uniref:UPAR/Ly6 domain-containing protein n=1 Tax=Oryctolagus cuniculus TaxID=9986 RepID=A0A5F9C6J0_RABIT
MNRLLLLLLPGALLTLYSDPVRKYPVCTSCDEYSANTCRKNPGVCMSKPPAFACQAKDIYIQHFTGEYVYQYSILRCPKRCVEFVQITKWSKTIFSCCNESYCNSLETHGLFIEHAEPG